MSDAVRAPFSWDAFRLKRLRANCRLAGAGKIVQAKKADFLSLDPAAPEFARVRAVLLDPSCSGSGTAGTRGDYLLAAARGEAVGGGVEGGGDDGQSPNHPAADERVAKLAQFQAKALSHALKFPAAERVSYSTCSVHALENELVVKVGAHRQDEPTPD